MTSRPGPASDDGAEAGPSSFPPRSGFAPVRETRSSSSQKRLERGQEVLTARGVGYPWPEQMARKMLRNVEKTRSSSSQKRSERGREVLTVRWVRYPLKSWDRNWSRKSP